ncbi:MAG: hypothetical protein CL543_01035 [Alcanivorax sp.]|nr:hypothetical protein [Alcanivorax sp.]MBI54804.1 hypothetical protein [Alcanivorax sp.]MBM1144740.1 DUF924 domain-containing protein [Alcanivorax sp. ZXX171]MBU57438.1 hypothetical protein [Alcanivorax sp.]HCE40434.1 DUF924 domain-containing protein [Alcanivorax sp.]|tara:strand:+ start:22837 stop:23445 length:609 start_codon:yes stop_codon:yes gene_type:complete
MDLSAPHRDILTFWFGDGGGDWPPSSVSRHWFKSTPARDAEIEERFGDRVRAALRRELVDWEREAGSRLALILLLDQFTRNIYRGTAEAFAGDHRAATLCLEGLSTGMDRRLDWAGQVFFCMPLMHAEDEDLQKRSVACYRDIQARAPEAARAAIGHSLKAAEEHLEIIQRFDRFPHRNEVLGRESTAEEREFLKTAKRHGQ